MIAPLRTAPRSTMPGCFPLPSLRDFQPTRILMLRDGGTILLDGTLNGERVSIRYDGNLNSKTHGKFFIAFGAANGKMSRERQLLPAEARDLLANVRGVVRSRAATGADADMYRILARNLRKALPRKAAAAA